MSLLESLKGKLPGRSTIRAAVCLAMVAIMLNITSTQFISGLSQPPSLAEQIDLGPGADREEYSFHVDSSGEVQVTLWWEGNADTLEVGLTSLRDPVCQSNIPDPEEPFTGTWEGPDPNDNSTIALSLVQYGSRVEGYFADTYSLLPDGATIIKPGYEGPGYGEIISGAETQMIFTLTRSDGANATLEVLLKLSFEDNTLTFSSVVWNGNPDSWSPILQRQADGDGAGARCPFEKQGTSPLQFTFEVSESQLGEWKIWVTNESDSASGTLAVSGDVSNLGRKEWIPAEGRDPVAAFMVPLFMYYLERYFMDPPEKTEIDLAIARTLDANPDVHEEFQRALANYKAISVETKQFLFDEVALALTAQANQTIMQAVLTTNFSKYMLPTAPSNLQASSPPPSSPLPVYGSIKLSWQDNSNNETGFRIYRGDHLLCKLQAPGVPCSYEEPDVKPYVYVSANSTTYTDYGLSIGKGYCYQVVAVSNNAIYPIGSSPTDESLPSNIACAVVKAYEPPPDKDSDGIPDKADQCENDPGPALTNGCPDSDSDGIPDIADKCKTQQGPPPDGCPIKFEVRWTDLHCLKESSWDRFSDSDEPYLIFALTNGGNASSGKPNAWTERWCCGDDVDDGEWEPDNNDSEEEFKANLPNLLQHGLRIFGKSQLDVIDLKAGLQIAITVMEHDEGDVVTLQKKIKLAIDMATDIAQAIQDCYSQKIVDCIKSIVYAVISVVNFIDSFWADDDYVGTATWSFSNKDALAWTSVKGVYAKKIHIDGGSDGVYDVHLCLFREGASSSSVKAVCGITP